MLFIRLTISILVLTTLLFPFNGLAFDEYTNSNSQKIGEYFRAANENVGALDCSNVTTERNVDADTKRAIKNRDGNRCVICGSTVKLEVDHKRALMNGGNNLPSNLATLCDDCHTEKTRMDNSLRRKRNKLCNK